MSTMQLELIQQDREWTQELFPAMPKKLCVECGAEVHRGTWPGKKTIYCSPDCADAACSRRQRDAMRARVELIKERVAMGEELRSVDVDGVDAVMVRAHTVFGWGLGKIATQTGLTKQTVRNRLILAGVYKPPDNSNGIARAGKGRHSRVAMLLRKRDSELKEQSRRQNAARWLRLLRKGKTLREIAIAEDIDELVITKALSITRTYTSWRNRKAPGKSVRFGLSRIFPKEKLLDNAIAEALDGAGLAYHRQRRLHNPTAQPDFMLSNGIVLECKVVGKLTKLYALVGQCYAYLQHPMVQGVVGVVPSDVHVPQSIRNSIESYGGQLATELDVIEKISKASAAKGGRVAVEGESRCGTPEAAAVGGGRP